MATGGELLRTYSIPSQTQKLTDYIHDDNLLQILKWLPAKTLFRFRCVCKLWKQLIDSQSFIQDHLAVQKPQFILNYAKNQFMLLDPRTLPLFDTLRTSIEGNTPRFDLVGTLHGVVCLDNNAGTYVLWNPSIRKVCLLLPESLDQDFLRFTCQGFWIDPSTKHYKIIRMNLRFLATGPVVDLTLYSSSLPYWRVLEPVVLKEGNSSKRLQANPPVVINGVAYWRACTDRGCTCTEDELGEEECATVKGMNMVILAFDFVGEKCLVIEAPFMDNLDDHSYHPIVSSWQGSLSVVYLKQFCARVSIYSRQQGSWVNVFDCHLLPNDLKYIHMLCAFGEREDRVRILAEKEDKLFLWDAKSGCHGNPLMSLLSEDSDRSLFLAYDFVESLLFP